MKLIDIPKGSKLRITVTRQNIKNKTAAIKQEIVTFNHIDGMYSHITTDDGEVLHLSATTPMKKVGNYYEIDKEQSK